MQHMCPIFVRDVICGVPSGSRGSCGVGGGNNGSYKVTATATWQQLLGLDKSGFLKQTFNRIGSRASRNPVLMLQQAVEGKRRETRCRLDWIWFGLGIHPSVAPWMHASLRLARSVAHHPRRGGNAATVLESRSGASIYDVHRICCILDPLSYVTITRTQPISIIVCFRANPSLPRVSVINGNPLELGRPRVTSVA